ncbi:unnamed protein product [Hymenolepis diminuta]|uniref:Mos1 transposase HTH domain-containing protein n=1 Tax=Hymenolepis diminuta TaxID=6216 RepID=A0A564Y8J3_HYMDI|nr:unnamed protein product [Hymenolepis diminuta]
MYTPNIENMRHILPFEFHKGNTASSAATTPKDTYGNDVVNEKTCKRWFSRFTKDDFSLKDEPRSGCSKILNSEQLEVAIDENPTCTTRKLSKTFNVSRYMTTYREIKRLGWESLESWEMGSPSTRFVRNKQAIACDLLCFTAFSWIL